MIYEHYKECSWHVDQYPWECDCGVERTKKAERGEKRLRKIMIDQMYELMGAEIDLKREGADQICLDTINRTIAAMAKARSETGK